MFNSFRYRNILFIALLLITVLPLLMLAFYSHPTADDFMYTNYYKSMGVFKNLQYQYFYWSGRYATSIIHSLTPLSFNIPWAYKYNTLVWLVLELVAIFWLSSKLFGSNNLGLNISVTSLFIFSSTIFLPFYGIYFWQTALYGIFTPNILTLLLLGCIIQYYGSTKKALYFTAACVLAIAIIGFYEVNLIYTDIIVFVLFLFSLIRKQNLRFPTTLLVLCILFSLIDIMAPGNHVRGNLYPKAYQFMYSFKQSYMFSLDILKHNWMPFMLLIALILGDLVSTDTKSSTGIKNIYFVSPFLVLPACIIIPFIGFFIGFYCEGAYPETRILNQAYFYFILGMMYFSISTVVWIKDKFNPQFKIPLIIKIPAYGCLLYLLLLYPNDITTAYKDVYSGTAAAFSKQLDEREAYLSSTKDDSCIVQAVKKVPVSFYYLDVDPDPKHWLDTNICRYYHKKYIGIKY